jgi:hypothetical protein
VVDSSVTDDHEVGVPSEAAVEPEPEPARPAAPPRRRFRGRARSRRRVREGADGQLVFLL